MAFHLGAEAYCLDAMLRRHVRQQVVEYIEEEREQIVGYVDMKHLGTTTRSASVRRQRATVRVPLGLEATVRQQEVEYNTSSTTVDTIGLYVVSAKSHKS